MTVYSQYPIMTTKNSFFLYKQLKYLTKLFQNLKSEGSGGFSAAMETARTPPAIFGQPEERGWGDQEPDGHSRKPVKVQKDKRPQQCSTPPIWALWQCDQMEASPHWKTYGSCLEFSKSTQKDSKTARNQTLWSDETRLNSLASIVSIMSWGSQALLITCPISSQQWSVMVAALGCGGDFTMAATERLVRVERRLNGAKQSAILNENLVQNTQGLRQRFGLQYYNNPYQTANTTQEWVRDSFVDALQRREPRTWISTDLPHLTLTELERICSRKSSNPCCIRGLYDSGLQSPPKLLHLNTE